MDEQQPDDNYVHQRRPLDDEDLESLYRMEVEEVALRIRQIQVRNRHMSFDEIVADICQDLDVQFQGDK